MDLFDREKKEQTILSDDQQLIAYIRKDDNTYNTSIVNMRTNQTIKTYLRFELLAFSKDNKFLFANIRGEFGTIKLEND